MPRFLTLLALAGFLTLTGCTADDLAGPELDSPRDAFPMGTYADPPSLEDEDPEVVVEPPTFFAAWEGADEAEGYYLSFEVDKIAGRGTSAAPAQGLSFGGSGTCSSFGSGFDIGTSQQCVVQYGTLSTDGEVSFQVQDTAGTLIAHVRGTVDASVTTIQATISDSVGEGDARDRNIVFSRAD